MAGRPRKTPAEEAFLSYTDEELERNIHELKLRACDDYFQLVGEMYFGEHGLDQLLQLRSLGGGLDGELGGVLTSPYREKEVLDDWTPLDIALFIGAITRYGRDWQDLRSALPHKTHRELTDFYYGVFKGLRIYPAWKIARKQKKLEEED